MILFIRNSPQQPADSIAAGGFYRGFRQDTQHSQRVSKSHLRCTGYEWQQSVAQKAAAGFIAAPA